MQHAVRTLFFIHDSAGQHLEKAKLKMIAPQGVDVVERLFDRADVLEGEADDLVEVDVDGAELYQREHIFLHGFPFADSAYFAQRRRVG